jgi:tetratricopeptide (TPR) repeat protein
VGDNRWHIDAPAVEGIEGLSFANVGEALTWFEAERSNLIAVARMAETSGLPPHALVLSLQFCTICMTYLDFDDWDLMSKVSLRAVTATGRAGDRALAHRNRGMYLFRRGALEQAREAIRESTQAYEQDGNRQGAAEMEIVLGLVELRSHHLGDALERFQGAAVTFAELGNEHSVALARMNVAHIQIELGDSIPAAEALPNIIATLDSLGDRAHYTNALNRLAHAHRNLGNLNKAKQAIDQALADAEERRAKVEEGVLLLEASQIQLALGDTAAALESCQLAAALQRQLGDKSREMLALTNTGDVMARMGRFEESLAFYLQAADQFRELQEPWSEARARLGAADAAAGLERSDVEREQLERVVACLEGFSDPQAAEMRRQVDERLG